jgi:sortase A
MRILFVKTFGRVLILAGALALAYSGCVYLEERRLQRAAGYALEEQMLHRRSARGSRDILLSRPGAIIGRIDIPRIHVSALVLEGSDSHILRIGAGHVQGTALPGTIGNIGIAAHRDTFFRPLREIRHDDMISLTTPHGVYRYQVEGTEIVDPNDIEVFNWTRDPELTLVTCYPFYYLGSAPKRFIVHARLQS